MSKSKIKKNNNRNQSINIFGSMKIELQKFKCKREEIYAILQEMCNLKNKASFVSSSNLSVSIGHAIESNRFAVLFDDQLFQLKKDVESTMNEITAALTSFANLLNTSRENYLNSESPESFIPVDEIVMSRLLTDMQQQHALENLVKLH
jgi:hypothetical protein